MKIALLGAPGAGKSTFATKLATALREQKGEVKRQTVKIVDKYVDRLIKDTGYAYGIFATYPQNFQILFERWSAEQRAENAGAETIITCGSLYETVLYTALRVNSNVALKEDQELIVHGRVAMEALGMIEKEIADHDLLFFLPYSEKTLAVKGRSYDTVINEKIPEVVSGYFKNLVALDGTSKKKVKDALRTIDAYAAWATEVASADEQPAI
jgi:energy-coupling factor transporter ATP-binding protein EcfA2